MRRDFLVAFVGFLFVYVAEARLTDNQVIYQKETGVLTVEPKKGFHLNAEAPASATFDALEAIYKPSEKMEKRFSFKMNGNAKKANLSYYVCDDKKTVCEQHQKELDLTTLSSTWAQPPQNFVDANLSSQLSDQLLNSKNAKPTLLIFSAPWCPACIRMMTETYSKPKVSEQLKKVNFVKLNSDLAENYEMSEKFQVKAIPTLILLNTDGEEVYRWLDFQEAGFFAKSLNSEIKKVSATKNILLRMATLGDSKAISAVGQLYYNALNCAEAVKWLSLSKMPQDQKLKLAAEVSCAQDQAEKDEKSIPEYLQTLEKAMVLTPSKMDQTRWMVDWIEKKKESKALSQETKFRSQVLVAELEKMIKAQRKLISDFKESTFGESAGFEVTEANLMRSRLYGALDEKAEKEKSDLKIIQSLKGRQFTIQKPGEMLIAIAYLREAGEKKRVKEMYDQLIAKYPATYVYHEKYARYELKEKNYDQALAHSNLALKYAEGNQPQLYLLKARVLKEMNLKEKMNETLETATHLQGIQHPKFKKTLAQLNKLKEESAQK